MNRQTLKFAKVRTKTDKRARHTKSYFQARMGGMGVCVGKPKAFRPYLGEWAK